MVFFSNLIRFGVRRWVRRVGLVLVVGVLCLLVNLWNWDPNTETAPTDGDVAASIAALQSDSLLPVHVAGCVVDQVLEGTGHLYPAGDSAQWLVNRSAVLDYCSTVQACAGSANSLAGPSGARFRSNFPLTPGRSSTITVEFDGTPIDLVVTQPSDFRPGVIAPVLLVLPARGEFMASTEDVAAQLNQEAVERGWVVVSPHGLGGNGFNDQIHEFVPAIVEWIKVWVTPEGGRPHLAGLGNSGVQAFDVAVAHPGAFSSLMVYPGFIQSSSDDAALDELCSIPVRMWVGGQDEWLDSAERTKVALADKGGDVRLTVVEGGGHTLLRGQDIRLFNALEELRSR